MQFMSVHKGEERMMRALKYTVNRRQFLQLSSLAASGIIGVACASRSREEEPEPTQQREPEPTRQPTPEPVGEMPPTVVDVYVWPAIPLVSYQGSHEAKYQAVQDYIVAELGIRPHRVLPPSGTAGREYLHQILSSRSDRLDIFTGDWTQYQDRIMPLTDLLEKYGQNILRAFPDVNWSGMKDADGTIWGIPRLGLMGHIWNFCWFREDWINDLDLPFDQARMTIAQLETMMTAFKAHNPEAVLVTNDLSGLEGSLMGGWTQYGRSRWYDETTDQIKPHQLQPGYLAWVTKMNEWWHNGWFHRDVFTNLSILEVMRSGNLGIYCGWYSRMTILGERIIKENVVPGMDFIFPRQMHGPMGLCGTNYAAMTSAYMIPAHSPVAADMIKYINWQYDPIRDNAVTAHYGLQGVDWEWVDDTKEQVRRLSRVNERDEMYAGELYQGAGLAIETWSAPADPLWDRHYDHIRQYVFDYGNGKTPQDFDVPYDAAAIAEAVPSQEAIDRLSTDEVIKFITGTRDLAEWDDFIDSLYRTGLQDWIDVYTDQYRTFKGL